MRHRFVDEALDELIAAGRYYNGQVPGLGDAFVNESLPLRRVKD
jgi:hypothetical protein